MAERRMFAKTIIDSDAFLDMPLSTQALYFHLSMRADDDGFINNAKKIQRMLGCSDDDMKILLAKNFIIPFETGVCVIKHWKIHNLIQKDRYKPTVYGELKNQLSLKNNNVYTLDTVCIQDVSSLETQVSIGKLSKDNINDDFNIFWEVYPKKLNKSDAIKAWKSVNVDLQTILDALQWQKELPDWKKENGQFVPYPASYLRGRRWEDEKPQPIKRGLVF
jgi:hypothetical protein